MKKIALKCVVFKGLIFSATVMVLIGLWLFIRYRDAYNLAMLGEDLRSYNVSYQCLIEPSYWPVLADFSSTCASMRLFFEKYPNVVGFCDFSPTETNAHDLAVAVLPSPQHPYIGILKTWGGISVAKLGSKQYYQLQENLSRNGLSNVTVFTKQQLLDLLNSLEASRFLQTDREHQLDIRDF